MSILVTGGGGYIGARLGARLSRSRPGGVGLVLRSAQEEWGLDARSFVRDMTREGWTEGLPEGIDCVVHLAQSRRYRDFPGGVMDMHAVNVRATLELLDWSRRSGVSHFVLASTGNVYRQQPRPLQEDDHCEPASFYGATKLCAENLAQQYTSYYAVTIARIFGVYGPYQTGMLMPEIIERVCAGDPVYLAGGEGIMLTPLYIRDCVDVLERLTLEPAPQGLRVLNVAGSSPASLRQVVSLLEELLSVRADTRTTAGNPRWLVADTTRLASTLGWVPQVPLRDGLSWTIAGAPWDILPNNAPPPDATQPLDAPRPHATRPTAS